MAATRSLSESEKDGSPNLLSVHRGVEEKAAFIVVIGGIRGRVVIFDLLAWQEIPRHERPEGLLSEDGRTIFTFTPQSAAS